jgi:hypothetical protein
LLETTKASLGNIAMPYAESRWPDFRAPLTDTGGGYPDTGPPHSKMSRSESPRRRILRRRELASTSPIAHRRAARSLCPKLPGRVRTPFTRRRHCCHCLVANSQSTAAAKMRRFTGSAQRLSSDPAIRVPIAAAVADSDREEVEREMEAEMPAAPARRRQDLDKPRHRQTPP